MPTTTQKNSKSTTNIDYVTLKKAVMTLRAINHPLRRQMMEIMKEQGQIIVTELFIKMRLEQSVVSQHLAILRRASIVTTIREGKFIYYAVDYARLEQINKFVEQLVG